MAAADAPLLPTVPGDRAQALFFLAVDLLYHRLADYFETLPAEGAYETVPVAFRMVCPDSIVRVLRCELSVAFEFQMDVDERVVEKVMREYNERTFGPLP